MFKQIKLIQLLFFILSFITLFSQGVTNNIFTWRLESTSLSLVLLIMNMTCFILGKIYGNIVNHIPLRLISYIFFLQSFLSIFLIPDIITLNCPFIFIKSFCSGILSSVVYSLMSNKTEKWRIRKYPIQIGIFAGITILSNILVYILSKFNVYTTIVLDSLTGYLIYRISSNDIKIQQIIEDKDKLTDFKLILNAFLNHINSIILFILQRKKEFIITQCLYILKIATIITFILALYRNVLFQNKTTYYYLAIQFLKTFNRYIKNETLHNHIEELYTKLEFRMIFYSTNNKNIKLQISKHRQIT
jgi:hypothetical protein